MARKPRGIVITVGNHKGGVGKTTNAVHIAVAMAERGHETLLIDLDPDHNATKHLGLAGKSYAGSFELMVRENADPVSLAVTDGMPPGFSIIPSRHELSEVQQYLSKFTVNVLKRPISAARENYDVIILDTPPDSKFITTLASYLAADWFLLSSFPETLSLYGFTETLDDIADVRNDMNPKLEVLGVVICNVDRRTNAWRNVLKLVEDNFPGREFQTFISRDQAVQHACERGKSVLQIAKFRNKPVAVQYRSLALEIEGRILNRELFLSGGQLALDAPKRKLPAQGAIAASASTATAAN